MGTFESPAISENNIWRAKCGSEWTFNLANQKVGMSAGSKCWCCESCDASLLTCLKRSLVPEIPISWYLSESIKYIVCPVNQCISDNSDGFLYPKNKNSSHSTSTFIYIYPTSQIHEAQKKNHSSPDYRAFRVAWYLLFLPSFPFPAANILE